NSSQTTPSLSVGEFGGESDFEISNGTLSSINASIGTGDSADARLTITSATWNNSGSLSLGSQLPKNLGAGHLVVDAGGSANIAGAIDNRAGSSIEVKNGGALTASQVINGGDFTSNGTLTINSSFTNTGNATFGGTQNWAAGSQLNVRKGTVGLQANAGTAPTPTAAGQHRLTLHQFENSSTVTLGSDLDLKNLIIGVADPGLQSFDLSSPAGASQYHALRIY